MEDLKGLEFLAGKSENFVAKQISTYRQKHSNSGTIIGIISLFIPFFLNGLKGSFPIVNYLSVIPICLFVWSLILFLGVFHTKPLHQGFSVNKFDELANKNLEEVLLFEIGANRSSFKDNEKVLHSANQYFNLGINLTIIGVLLSIALLLFNNFWKPVTVEEPLKVEIVKTKP